MSTASIDTRIQFHFILWYGLITVAALFLGLLLASNLYMVAFIVAGVGWLTTLPFHGRLATVFTISAYLSAFLVPLFPGRLYVWEAAALLAWSGVPITISLRRFPPDSWAIFQRNFWVFAGLIGYAMVLVATMRLRGVGFGSLGAETAGGRTFFQELAFSAVPLMLLLTPLKERTFMRLVYIHFLLSLSWLIGDFVVYVAPTSAFWLLHFVQMPHDAFQFDIRTLQIGFSRYQSLFYACPNVIFALLVRYKLHDFVGRRGVWLLPLVLSILALGLMSGHRKVPLYVGCVVLVLLVVQRMVTAGNLIRAGLAGILMLAFLYSSVGVLPGAVQRAVSFLPGLNISPMVRSDAAGTWMVRKEVTRIGWGMIPDYFWLGRGFVKYTDSFSSRGDAHEDTIAFHIDQGEFRNGFVGLMVQTGIFGTTAMTVFLVAGLVLCFRILREVRAHGFDEPLSRAAALFACMYITNFVFFYLVEGNASWVLRQFGMPIGLLLVCWRLLRNRRVEEDRSDEEAAPA